MSGLQVGCLLRGDPADCPGTTCRQHRLVGDSIPYFAVVLCCCLPAQELLGFSCVRPLRTVLF
jgi:hypothetical protein